MYIIATRWVLFCVRTTKRGGRPAGVTQQYEHHQLVLLTGRRRSKSTCTYYPRLAIDCARSFSTATAIASILTNFFLVITLAIAAAVVGCVVVAVQAIVPPPAMVSTTELKAIVPPAMVSTAESKAIALHLHFLVVMGVTPQLLAHLCCRRMRCCWCDCVR